MRVLVATGDQVGLARSDACFHHNDWVAGVRDGEPELVTLHAEVVVAGLNLRVPQHRRRGTGPGVAQPVVPGK